MMVIWKYKKDEDARQGNTSIAIAAHVTAYGRIKLIRLLQKIDSVRPNRVIYHDTDSVIFLHEEGDEIIPCGENLGDLTDEISKDYGAEAYIKEVVCLGPKNYAMTIVKADKTEETVIKMKGVSLHSKSMASIGGIDQLRVLAEAYTRKENRKQEVIMIDQQRIGTTDRYHQNLTSTNFQKKLRATSSKRRIIGNNTVPYGYVDEFDRSDISTDGIDLFLQCLDELNDSHEDSVNFDLE